MRYPICMILIGLFISSCSNSDDDSQEITNPTIKLKFKAEQTTGNIYEMFVFNLYSEEGGTLFDIENTYDSLVWTVPDLGRFHLLKKDSFINQWSQVFFLTGKNKTILLGYKDNKIITSDSIDINVLKKNTDFLYFNWVDVKESKGSTAYADILAKDYTFATYQSIKDSIPSITLFLLNEGKDDGKTFSQKSEKILFDYIKTLYSEPTYTEKQNELLTKEYNKLFNNKEKGAKPISIWITPKSKIVLYSYYEEYGGYNEYRIQAEPN